MKILFQGDSITDAARVKDDESSMGKGYAQFIKASLGLEEPGKYDFVNRGINCSKIEDVYSRAKPDIIDLKPDVLSILIGVNDIWQYYAEVPNGTPAEKYYELYDMLIKEVKAALPDVKIMILEPFILRGSGTYMLGSGGSYERYDEFRSRIEEIAEKAGKIAEKHGLVFVPLQKDFDDLSVKAEEGYWLSDGVHPTPMGHEFIKREWIKAFRKFIVDKT